MIRVLFICHGNICRSVCAQYVLEDMIEKNKLNYMIEADSAATSREEIGSRIYPPMEKTLKSHGVKTGDHRARQITKKDYENYDMLIGTDDENLYYMNRIFGGDPEGKFSLLMDYTDSPGTEISDPWYTRDFERTYRDVVKGCAGLMEYLKKN